MNIIRKAVATLGGIFLAALLIAALAPKTARGIAAALVQVTNTSSNPVPTVMSGTPFEAATCHSFGATQGTLCGAQSSDFVVPSITAAGAPVKRLVVEHVSGICTGENTPLIAAILIGPFVADAVPNTAGSMFHYFPLILQTTGPGPSGLTEQDYSFGGTTRIYFNPGDTVTQRAELLFPRTWMPSASPRSRGHWSRNRPDSSSGWKAFPPRNRAPPSARISGQVKNQR